MEVRYTLEAHLAYQVQVFVSLGLSDYVHLKCNPHRNRHAAIKILHVTCQEPSSSLPQAPLGLSTLPYSSFMFRS